MSEPSQLAAVARWLLDNFLGRCWFGVDLLRLLDDEMWLHRLREVSDFSAIPLVAAGDVHFHVRSRKPLQDVLTATRVGRPLSECGLDLQPNAERHLRTRLRLAQTYPADLLAETLNVASRCVFNLDELRYQYPDEVVPAGETSTSYLRRITYEGAGRRWPRGMPAKVAPAVLFATGYLLSWGGFSAVATALQWGLESARLLSPMLTTTNHWLGVAILIAAGLWQLTPLKAVCLRHCRTPLGLLVGNWRPGQLGALRMGLEHGGYCLGCCWFLMSLLFFGGVMNLYWIAGLTAFVLMEKTIPLGHWLGRLAGVALVSWGGVLAIQAP